MRSATTVGRYGRNSVSSRWSSPATRSRSASSSAVAPSRRSCDSTSVVEAPRSSAFATAAMARPCQRSIRASVASRYSPPNAALSEPLRRYSSRAPAAIARNASAIRTCHSHHDSRQLRLTATAIAASPRRTRATPIASAVRRPSPDTPSTCATPEKA